MFLLTPEWLIVLVIIILIFGVGKLPQVGQGLSDTIQGFRRSLKGEAEPDRADSAPSLPAVIEGEGIEAETVPVEPGPAEETEASSPVRAALPQAATLSKEERLAFALDALLEHYNISPHRLARESGVDRATISRWIRGAAQPQQDKLEKILDAIPDLSPRHRQEALALAGYATDGVQVENSRLSRVYLSCHGQDLAVERDSLARVIAHPLLEFKVEIGEAGRPPAEIEASMRHSDYLVMVQGWRWAPARHIEVQAAIKAGEKLTGLYFQRKSGLPPEPLAERFQLAVGASRWQPFVDPHALTVEVVEGLRQTMTRQARTGQAVSLPRLTGLSIMSHLLAAKETSPVAVLQRLAAAYEGEAGLE